MLFSVQIRDASGARREIAREADSPAEVVSALRAEGLLVLDVREAKRTTGTDTPAWHPAWLLPATSFDVEMGVRQLSSMLHSGVSLLAALQTVQEQSRRPRAARIWKDVRARVFAGESFSQALGAHARTFGDVVIELVRVGEHSGELDTALTRAAEQLEGRRTLRSMVANALVYPCLAILMTLGITVFLVVSVIPKVAEFLQSGGASLPATTQMLMDVSEWTTRNGPALLVGLVVALVAFFLVRATNAGREALDAAGLHVPVSGRILRLSGTAMFARAMGILIDSGVSLLDALSVTERLLANRRLRRRIRSVREAVLRGGSLAPALQEAREFMPMLSRMAAVGETTGSLGESFAETARFHEMLLTVAIKRFSVTIEPLMICIAAAIVGFVYISFFMALFSLAGAG